MVSHPRCPPPRLHQKHDPTSTPGCSYGSGKKSQESKPHKSPRGGTLSMQIQREKVDQWARGRNRNEQVTVLEVGGNGCVTMSLYLRPLNLSS